MYTAAAALQMPLMASTPPPPSLGRVYYPAIITALNRYIPSVHVRITMWIEACTPGTSQWVLPKFASLIGQPFRLVSFLHQSLYQFVDAFGYLPQLSLQRFHFPRGEHAALLHL